MINENHIVLLNGADVSGTIDGNLQTVQHIASHCPDDMSIIHISTSLGDISVSNETLSLGKW